jgi:hypothetical protein
MSDESTMTAPAEAQAEGSMAVGPMSVAKGKAPSPDVPPGGVENPIVIPSETFREQVPEVRTNNFVNRMV